MSAITAFTPTIATAKPISTEKTISTAEKLRLLIIRIARYVGQAIFGFLQRALSAPILLIAAISPKAVFHITNMKVGYKKLTKENIEKDAIYPAGSMPEEMHVPTKERLLHVLNRVEILASKLGIKKKIQVYSGPEYIGNAAMIGSNMIIDAELINLPDDQLDAILGHELTHFKKDHLPKRIVFHLLILAVDIVAIALFCSGIFALPALLAIPVVFAIEAAAGIMGDIISRAQEKECDINSMKHTSKSGMVNSWKHFINKNLSIKNAKSEEDLQKILDPRSAKKLNSLKAYLMKSNITSRGDNFYNFSHPQLTERLKYCKNFNAAASA